MNEKRWDEYIEEILSHVKFRFDHRMIRQELLEHMEDLYEELTADGMDEEIAYGMTVEFMGESAEIGQELNKEHHAVLGIVWYMARLLVVITFLATIMTFIYLVHDAVVSVYCSYIVYSDRPVVFSVEKEYKRYDDTLILDGLKFHEDGILDIRYKVNRNPFAESIFVHRDVNSVILDANGENLHVGNFGSAFESNTISGVKGQIAYITPDEAETLVLSWSDLELHIDLDSGEVSMH